VSLNCDERVLAFFALTFRGVTWIYIYIYDGKGRSDAIKEEGTMGVNEERTMDGMKLGRSEGRNGERAMEETRKERWREDM
jgi:hypothetical protein